MEFEKTTTPDSWPVFTDSFQRLERQKTMLHFQEVDRLLSKKLFRSHPITGQAAYLGAMGRAPSG